MDDRSARAVVAPEDPVKLLANATNRAILALLGAGPCHPREIARRLGVTEGDATRKLGRLARAGIVEGAWRHDGRTVKEYRLAVAALEVAFSSGGIVVRRTPPPAGPA